MRISYFAHLNGGSHSGVVRKIAAQAAQWRAHGHVVRFFVATRDQQVPWQSDLEDVVLRQYAGPVSRLRTMVELVRTMRTFDPDIVYLRWDLFYPPMLWFPRRAPLVVEVNSDDVVEYALGSRVRAAYNRHTRPLILRRAGALVFVTAELSNRASFNQFPGRHVVITNGIDLSEYPELPARAAGNPRLVFVGTAGQPWHGIDQLVALAAARPAWRFDIVGMAADTPRSPANVSWHGPLARADALEVLAGADVGVGTLALHRKGMTEACPLKVREYLAVGLPVMYGYADPDADSLSPLVLPLPNTESGVMSSLASIDTFVHAARGVRVPRSRVAHIDVAVKESQRLALFDELAAG